VGTSVNVRDVNTYSIEAVNATISGAASCQSLAVIPGVLLADHTAVTMYGPQVQIGDLLVAGAGELSSTGIMLTGGPTTYVKSLQGHDLFATSQVTTNGNLNGQSLNISSALSADSGGVYMNGPAAHISTILCQTLTGGTGSFQSLQAHTLFASSQVTTNGNVNAQSLNVASALSADSTGVYMNGPAAHISSILCQTLTGGTGSFQSLTVGTQSIVSLGVGQIVGTGLWSGVAAIAQSLSLPQYAMASSYTSASTYLHLGTWTAPVGGHVLKLNYLSCCGFNVNQAVSSTYPGTITTYGPQIVDLNIYFYTSDGSSHATLANGTPVFGYGYGVSTHVTAAPQGLWVTTTGNMVFDFYLLTGPMIGNPVLTAMTSQTWVTDLTSSAGSFQSNWQRLKIASSCTSMCKNYGSF